MEVKGEKSASPAGFPIDRGRCADCGRVASRDLWIIGGHSVRYCDRCSDARWESYLASREAVVA